MSELLEQRTKDSDPKHVYHIDGKRVAKQPGRHTNGRREMYESHKNPWNGKPPEIEIESIAVSLEKDFCDH